MLLKQPSIVAPGITQVRSQIVVGYQGDRERKWTFIDLLGLDTAARTVWVIELKAVRADRRSVAQVRRYAQWVSNHLNELLNESNGYFVDTGRPDGYRVAAAVVAPEFSSTCLAASKALENEYPVQLLQLNTGWRKGIRLGPVMPCIEEKIMSKYRGRWADDAITVRLVLTAEESGIVAKKDRCDPVKLEYVNLRQGSTTGKVVAQIHKVIGRETEGRALVVRRLRDGLDTGAIGRFDQEYEQLSGDTQPSNAGWLRAAGNFEGKFPPAKVVFVPNSLLALGKDSPTWLAIRELFLSLTKAGAGRPTAARKAIAITHGDVDGMVCAAQVMRLEGTDCEVVFSNARAIARHLEAIARKGFPERIYITDIPCNEASLGVLRDLHARGVAVWWVDHHPWAGALVEQVREVCSQVEYRDSTATPAGILLSGLLTERDPYYGRIGRICYAYERGSEWERDWFRLLASYVGKADSSLLERLAFDRPLTEEDRARISRQVDAEKRSEAMLVAEQQTVRTSTGRSMAVYDTSDQPGVFLGKKVFQYHDVDYCLVRISERKWQLASNPSVGLSLTGLIGEHVISGMEVSVGGRPRLLALTVAAHSAVPRDAHEAMVLWVAGRL